MTVTNHALAGALIAGLIASPAVTIPLAFVSHYVLDALPHFGIAVVGDDVRSRNTQTLFKWVTRVDVALLVAALVFVPIAFQSRLHWPVVLGCMVAALSPDAIWGYRFIRELKTGKLGPKSWFSRFHNWIQWGECRLGLIVDVCWFAACTVLLMELWQ